LRRLHGDDRRYGVTAEEIAELLLHAGVYAGIPIASEGFRRADRVIADVKAGK
jgi:4-carboxymuconolactone decarboxylase